MIGHHTRSLFFISLFFTKRVYDKTKTIIFSSQGKRWLFAYTKLVSVPGTLSAGTAPTNFFANARKNGFSARAVNPQESPLHYNQFIKYQIFNVLFHHKQRNLYLCPVLVSKLFVNHKWACCISCPFIHGPVINRYIFLSELV